MNALETVCLIIIAAVFKPGIMGRNNALSVIKYRINNFQNYFHLKQAMSYLSMSKQANKQTNKIDNCQIFEIVEGHTKHFLLTFHKFYFLFQSK